MAARRKQEAVLPVLRGEPLDFLARELRVTTAELSAWREASLEAGTASLESRPRDDRDVRIARLQAKFSALIMHYELLRQKIDRIESGRP